MAATLTTLAEIYKRFYLPNVRRQLNDEILMLNRLENNKEAITGSAAYLTIHVSRSAGIGARAEAGTLPTAGNQEYLNLSYNLKYPAYGAVSVTGPSIELSASNAGAYLQAKASELDGIRRDLQKDVARQVYGDGTAAICTVSNGGAGVTQTVGVEPIKKGQLYVGMVIDVGTAANYDSKLDGDTITAIDPVNGTITTSSADLSSGGPFYVIRAANADSSTVVHEIDHGLQKIVSSTASVTVGGLAPSSFALWEPQVDSAGGALTEDRMLQMWSNLGIAGGNLDKTEIFTSFGGLRRFYNLKVSQVRFDGPERIKGGFAQLPFMGTNLVADLEHPYGVMHFLDLSHIWIFANRDWHFLDEDGLTFRKASSTDAWEAYITRYMNMGTDNRRVHGVLTFDDTTGV